MKYKNEIVQYSFPTSIYLGAGARYLLAESFHNANIKRVFLITDRTMASFPFIKEIKQDLLDKGIEEVIEFHEIWGNPVESQVYAGVEVYKKYNCQGAVAIGGGAVLDVAKAILLMVDAQGKLFDYEDGKEGARAIDPSCMPYFIAMPTTAGTGSEVGRSAVISEDTSKKKKIIFHSCLLPKVVFSDPELTLDLPASVTAYTGIDALTHCIEAYLSTPFHPICDGIALEGIRLISRSLEKCVSYVSYAKDTPIDEQIFNRALMLNSAMMGAIAFQKGLGLNHSCAHSLSTVNDLHHGLANAIVLPIVMEFNKAKVPEKFQVMEQCLENTEEKDFIKYLVKLKESIGIPKRLSEVGVKESDLEKLVEIAFQDPCHTLNPRPVTEDDLRNIFKEAL